MRLIKRNLGLDRKKMTLKEITALDKKYDENIKKARAFYEKQVYYVSAILQVKFRELLK